MKTPLELLFNELPDYTFLKVFGCACACWPHLRPYNSRKLEFLIKGVTPWGGPIFTDLGVKSMGKRGEREKVAEANTHLARTR